ncbi:hypothetical protein QEG98_26265 [Myxococcus sp. MxC21-1]|uniref:hypothetical protein n=1 Tax=Myxococcus sp. MxC21-1 TaxID=3041439 RepID=UPI0029309055|nr:hypothetical protein [Myxococcus sp. MxC21-1]WNZ59549.1 hypothetical protein QEG98_26265 [Myxococcus sp. MxC21-1]
MYDNALSLVHCSLCDLGYAPYSAEDRRWHATYHARVDKLAAHLGRWPAGYSERERQKADGDRLIRHGANLADKLSGAELVLTALYDREVLQSLHRQRPRQPPTFTSFLRNLDLAAVVGEEIALHVRQQHRLREKRRAHE